MNSPILFIIFNRPDTTQVVFEAISHAKPPRLYIAADGPRLSNPDDTFLCKQARSIVNKIDWNCEVKTLFRESNLGCREAVSGAIDWFFQNEEEGIILEDDVVPNPEFFKFCEDMLSEYRDVTNVAMISGFNPLGAKVTSPHYFFSRYASIWGWATWRSRWKFYDVNLSEWSAKYYEQIMRDQLPLHVLEYFIDALEKVQRKQMNTWDYQWSFFIQLNNLLVVRPEANLIANIGVSGTHSKCMDKNHNTPYGFIDLSSLSGPQGYISDESRDLDFYKYAFEGQKYRLLIRFLARKLFLLQLLRNLRKIN